ncbi:MAG: hypothetical protein Q8S00_31970 [Deltaproteobacteria bacterium]|nr:hypothetical protein [Deltaproteobacteria bacterium]
MEQYKGYWITGSADPGPPYTTYWEILGTILKPHRGGSVVEVARLRLPAFTVEIKELEEWFGLELAWIVVDEY